MINVSLCSAQSANQISNQYGVLSCYGAAAGLPGGSWSKSCTPTRWVGGWLAARCGLANGVISALNTNLCSQNSAVSNLNGRLICNNPLKGLVGGSWFQSCSPLYWNRRTQIMVATCGTTVSSFGPFLQPSFINLGLCANGAIVTNSYGLLVCSAVSPRLPGGSWYQSCSPLTYNTSVPGTMALVATCAGGPKNVLTGMDHSLCVGSPLTQINSILICSEIAAGYPGRLTLLYLDLVMWESPLS